MKLSTKGRYSVTALYELALRYGKGVVPLHAIAATQGISEHYLEQLMVPLRRAGLVESVRGRRSRRSSVRLLRRCSLRAAGRRAITGLCVALWRSGERQAAGIL